MVLAGDTGGTNARLALFEPRAGVPALVADETYPSRAHAGLKELLLAFRERHGQRLEAAGLGIAGPEAGPPFLAAFPAKGRLRPLLEDTPVRVVLEARAGLIGAARRALERSS